MESQLAPFSCTHTPEMPDILTALNCTLILSTYQAGKVIFLSTHQDGLIQLPRSFAKPMGLALQGDRLAIATRNEVVVLANSPGLARGYPAKPGAYDGLFAPRAVYFTGELDVHDLAWGNEGLWAVNTRFSCLSIINDCYSFLPRWKPPFISELTPDDRCHLNGMAMVNGRPEYATALGRTDAPGQWREGKLHGGVLIHVPTGEIVLEGLAMPHSPRVFDGSLYFLNSSTGELMIADPDSGKAETVNRMPGFLRGMVKCGDYLLIGLSKIRKKHIFSDMPITKQETFAGIVFVHLPSGALAGSIRYLTACEEIYDVQVLTGLSRPGIINQTTSMHKRALVTPEEAFWSIEEPEETPPQSTGGPAKP